MRFRMAHWLEGRALYGGGGSTADRDKRRGVYVSGLSLYAARRSDRQIP